MNADVKACFEVLRSGPLTTVQDLGRRGHAELGFAECGACDKYALRLANLLCGNEEGEAALEYTLSGPALRFTQDAVFVLAGAETEATLDGAPCPMYAPCLAPAGAVLDVGSCVNGLRGYIAVRGGIAVPAYLGSRATDLKCHLGGFAGRALKAGDRVPIVADGDARAQAAVLSRRAAGIERGLFAPLIPRGWLGWEALPVLRAVPGPQDDTFTEAGLAAFAREIYTVSPKSDRMAARLAGQAVAAKGGVDIVSDGIVEGSVQIAADGQPIVMLADHQTTGGYAKIATVLPTDIPALAQLRPGARVRFRLVTREEGMRALRLEGERLKAVRGAMRG